MFSRSPLAGMAQRKNRPSVSLSALEGDSREDYTAARQLVEPAMIGRLKLMNGEATLGLRHFFLIDSVSTFLSWCRDIDFRSLMTSQLFISSRYGWKGKFERTFKTQQFHRQEGFFGITGSSSYPSSRSCSDNGIGVRGPAHAVQRRDQWQMRWLTERSAPTA